MEVSWVIRPELQLERLLLQAGLQDILVEVLLQEGLRTGAGVDPLGDLRLPAERPTWR